MNCHRGRYQGTGEGAVAEDYTLAFVVDPAAFGTDPDVDDSVHLNCATGRRHRCWRGPIGRLRGQCLGTTPCRLRRRAVQDRSGEVLGPWHTAERLEIATLEYVDWFNHFRLC